jgi:hypothetical protein
VQDEKSFAFRSLIRNFDIRRISCSAQAKASFESFRSEMKPKTLVFALHFPHLFVILRQSREVATSRHKKKKRVSFVLPLIFRNFARQKN